MKASRTCLCVYAAWQTHANLAPIVYACVLFWGFFLRICVCVFLSAEGNGRLLLNQWGTTLSISTNEPFCSAKANSHLEKSSCRRAGAPQSFFLLLFFPKSDFNHRSPIAISLVCRTLSRLVVTCYPLSLLCQMTEGKVMYVCSQRSHNIPSEVLRTGPVLIWTPLPTASPWWLSPWRQAAAVPRATLPITSKQQTNLAGTESRFTKQNRRLRLTLVCAGDQDKPVGKLQKKGWHSKKLSPLPAS